MHFVDMMAPRIRELQSRKNSVATTQHGCGMSHVDAVRSYLEEIMDKVDNVDEDCTSHE